MLIFTSLSMWKSFVLILCKLLAYKNRKGIMKSQYIVEDLAFSHKFRKMNSCTFIGHEEVFFVIYQLVTLIMG